MNTHVIFANRALANFIASLSFHLFLSNYFMISLSKHIINTYSFNTAVFSVFVSVFLQTVELFGRRSIQLAQFD